MGVGQRFAWMGLFVVLGPGAAAAETDDQGTVAPAPAQPEPEAAVAEPRGVSPVQLDDGRLLTFGDVQVVSPRVTAATPASNEAVPASAAAPAPSTDAERAGAPDVTTPTDPR